MKRKHHDTNELPSKQYAYAAQVFAEMLGQINPGDWLDLPDAESQEVVLFDLIW